MTNVYVFMYVVTVRFLYLSATQRWTVCRMAISGSHKQGKRESAEIVCSGVQLNSVTLIFELEK